MLTGDEENSDPTRISAREALLVSIGGLGPAPTASVKHPVSQGITQSFSVFSDTMVICSCAAFVILLGDVYVPGAKGIDGVALTPAKHGRSRRRLRAPYAPFSAH